MKTLLTIILTLALAVTASAFDLGSHGPDKPVVQHTPGAPDADVLRQGGDTILDAVPLTVPVVDLAGTTVGYTDDYDEQCPFGASTSPDVVYSITPAVATSLSIDLFGSAYDTKVYVYDETLALVACNDDFYSDYTSFLSDVHVDAGVVYYVVVDGYGGDAGDYLLNITEFTPCELECPVDGELEGEPPLVDDYTDTYNGGCGDGGTGGWQAWNSPVLCGVSGWYVAMGANSRDTDWFEVPIGPAGVLEIEGDAEEPMFMFELGPQDCDTVGVLQNVSIGPCIPATITIIGEPGEIVWFWVGPQTFASPIPEVFEFDYVLVNHTQPVAVEEYRWSGVKDLFR